VQDPFTQKIYLKITKAKKGEKHHLEKKVVDKKAIVNICVSKEAMHENHAKEHDVCMAGQHGEWVQQNDYNNF
jgi:hypothetical protein